MLQREKCMSRALATGIQKLSKSRFSRQLTFKKKQKDKPACRSFGILWLRLAPALLADALSSGRLLQTNGMSHRIKYARSLWRFPSKCKEIKQRVFFFFFGRLFFANSCERDCIITITFEAIPARIVVHKKRKTGIAVRRTLFFHNLEAGEHKNQRKKKITQIKAFSPDKAYHACRHEARLAAGLIVSPYEPAGRGSSHTVSEDYT